MKENNNIIIYQADNEVTRVSVRFADEEWGNRPHR